MGLVALSVDLLTFKVQTGVRVASEVGNLHSEFGHARPLGSRVIRYVRDGRTDGRTKATFTAPFYGRGHNNILSSVSLSFFSLSYLYVFGRMQDVSHGHFPLGHLPPNMSPVRTIFLPT